MKLHKLYLPHALGLIFFSGASLSHAQITEWQTTTQNWFTPANWNNGTPTLTVPALIDNGGTAQVTSAGAETLNLILGNSTSGGLSVSGSGTLNSADFLTVGNNGVGTLDISSGGSVTAVNSSIAQGTGSGTTTVSGSGSMLNLSNDLTSGSTGTGILNILSQGTVENSGLALIGSAGTANGTVNVTGAGSTWTANDYLAVGSSGTGILSITNGGSVSVGSIGDIGSYASGNGTLNVNGVGSQYIQTGGGDLSLAIGYEGTGSATISNGGHINHSSVTEDLLIASESGSTGTLNIGGASGASATVAGTVDATGITGGSGSATVNFNHTNSNYALTNDGTTSGTAVVLSGSVAVNHTGSGSTTLNGANTYTGDTTINDGTLYLDGSITSDTTVEAGGTLSGSGISSGAVLVKSGATIAPGNSPGTLTVDSLDLEAGATVNIELGGALLLNFDLLSIENSASLDGILDIVYVNGFTANLGDSFTILNAGDLTGAFATINLPDAQNWEVVYNYTDDYVNLVVVPEPSTSAFIVLSISLLAIRRRTQ
ncbi:MAG: autotransporter-associated beta strand repeat-containing protein [Akkermansiaceae bacterium]